MQDADRGRNMSITGVKQSSGIRPVNEMTQDNYEKNIQKQIANLQQRMKSLNSDRELSGEQKMNEKKALQEKIQSLNSELKQHQLQRRQEETAKKQEEARRATQTDNTDPAAAESVSATEEQPGTGFSEGESGVIISVSHTREQVAHMQKVRTRLEGQMLTAPTEEEKADLQERIDRVSRSMGEKLQKIADTIKENQQDEQERRERIRKVQQREAENREKNINVVLPTGGSGKPAERGSENFIVTGNVTIS